MKNNEYPNQVLCPLIETEIEAEDCIVVVDCSDGLVKDSVIAERFKSKEDWSRICQNCVNRKYQD